MKTLADKLTSIPMDGEADGTYLRYADLIRMCLDSVPEGGFAFDDLRKRTRIEKALVHPDNGSIRLEDNDAENLKAIVGRTRWTSRHRDLLQFQDDIGGMSDLDADKTTDPKK